jgi:hypothetical protein
MLNKIFLILPILLVLTSSTPGALSQEQEAKVEGSEVTTGPMAKAVPLCDDGGGAGDWKAETHDKAGNVTTNDFWR